MSSKTRILTLLLCVIMVVTMLPSVALAVEPIETDKNVTFTISYKDDGKAISGAVFDIYHCANIDANGQMTVTDAFASYPADFDRLDQDGWQELATTLKGYAQRDDLSTVASGQTDSNGEITITLKPGLYLVVGNRRTIGNYTYTAVPFVIFLPGKTGTENVWNYDVTSTVKFAKKYNPPENPPDDDTITRKVLKIWDDYGYEFARPEEIIVQLLKDGKVSDTQTLNAENGWRYTWNDLNADAEWTIVEKELDDYYTKTVQEGITFTITNKYIIPLVIENPPVAKKITGDTPTSQSAFTFVLSAADVSCPMPAGSTGTIKEITIIGSGSSEFGQITFTKPGTFSYVVSEKNTGVEGYTYDTAVYTIKYIVTEKDGRLSSQRIITETNGKEVNSPVFTNKYTKPGNKLPQTGMPWWPVLFLLCIGLAFYVVGFTSKRKQRDDK